MMVSHGKGRNVKKKFTFAVYIKFEGSDLRQTETG